MRRPTPLLSTLRSTSTALCLCLGLWLPACGDDGTSLETGEEPGSTGGEVSESADPSGDPTAPATSASSDPTTSNGPGSTGEPDTDTVDTGDEVGSTGDPEEPTLEEQLVGHWVSEVCEAMPQADGSVLYFIRDFTLGTGTWSIVGTIYGDEACSYPLLGLEIGGAFEIVGPAAGIDGAHEGNFDRSSIALTPYVPDFVAWFDGEGCGDGPWAVGVQQDVTENGCAFVPSSMACPVEHDLVSLDGPDRLFFGQRPAAGDMCSPENRPTALGESAVARQES